MTCSPILRPVPVGSHICLAEDALPVDGDDRLPWLLFHPTGAGLLERLVVGKAGASVGHRCAVELENAGSVFFRADADVHELKANGRGL